MPNRIIHEKATRSVTLDTLSDGAERFFWRLTTQADDHGCFDADPRVLLADCFPLRVDRLKPVTVERWRDECAAAGLIALYRVEGRLYGQFVAWSRYQRPRESKPKYPAPEAGIPESAATRGDSPQLAASRGSRARDRETRDVRRESRDVPIPRSPRTAAPEAVTPRNGTSPESTADPWARAPWPSPEALAYRYNTLTTENVPAVESLSPRRRDKAARRLRQFPDEDWWLHVFREYHRSQFLSGRSPPRPGHDRFRPDFDWLLANGKDGTENCVKVRDGNYR